jgi:uncharacterized protein (TIGR04255 family)
MPAEKHYPRAPIKEALIDLRVKHADGSNLDSMKAFGSVIEKEYPYAATRGMVQAKISGVIPGPQPNFSSSQTVLGYIYHSTDRLQAVQGRLDGFTFSRFFPYQDWASFRAEAQRLWDIYVKTTEAKIVERVAVRYLNVLDLPAVEGTVRFEDYIQTLPNSGIEGDQELEQFLVRLVLPQSDLNGKLVLTETLLPEQLPNRVSLLIDIDLFRESSSFSVNDAEIWNTLDKFRLRKNEYFEAAITDKAREMFR